MKKTIWIVIVIAFLTPTTKTFAWGRDGHHIISQLAFQMLKPETQAKYVSILNGISIDSASIWMDAVKGKQPYTYLDVTHYINAEKGMNFDFTATNNVYAELNLVFAALQNNVVNNPTKQEQVLILTHLIEDLHQPLHVGYGVDRGGNSVMVQYNNKKYNLHALWDYGIIEQTHISKEELWANIQSMWGCTKKSIQRKPLEEWLIQSRVPLAQVYNFKNDTIDKKYETRARRIIKKQMIAAALRLAATIEKYLG